MENIYDKNVFFDKYSKMERSKKGLSCAGEWHQFKNLLPDFNGKTVLDLGCGYGWHCKNAVDNGAILVHGIDSSEKMIEHAKKINFDSKIEYYITNINEYLYPTEAYDCVISNLVLHYINDINSIYKKVNKTLKKDGVFIFNIEHPIFTCAVNEDWIYNKDGKPKYWPIDNYFKTGEIKTNFLDEIVIKQHHTISQILMGLLNNGFKIDSVIEPTPSEEMLNIEGMADELRRPMMLIVKAIKL
ncbi:MAG: class I SAM-dependent methyltransferase [Oscillospiraceae bacterium]